MKVHHLFESQLPYHKGTLRVDTPHESLAIDQQCYAVVDGDFDCSGNVTLKSLEGGPKQVNGDFYANGNSLTNLDHLPKITGAVWIHTNQLTSLKGCPKEVNGYFTCGSNQLTSVTGTPEIIHGDANFSYNPITSLKDVHKHIKQVDGSLHVEACPLHSNVLGVLLIKNVQEFFMTHKRVQNIINDYLPNNRGMEAVFECQEKLIEEGYEEFAEL